jgi:digeranylgeranylglycerophospholipid reductase
LNDVIVVGGGPVGSYVARGLAGVGYSVEVFEKGTKNNEKICCTGIVSKKCYQSFLPDKNLVLKNGRSARVYSPSGKVIHLHHEEDQAYVINRTALDSIMASEAITAGAKYYQNCIVKKIDVRDDGVRVEISREDETLTSEAKMVVIATGFGARLFRKNGFGQADNYAVGAQIEVKHRDISEIEIYTGRQVAPGFFGWLVPVDSKKALVGLMARRNPDLYLKRLLSLLKEQGKIDINGDRPSYRGITLQPPKRTYGNRFIVVGDAAGQVKPLTGGGIYYGLMCAEIAVNNLKKALYENDFQSVKLAKYEKEWKRKLGKEINICRWTHKIYERLSDSQLDKVFNITTSHEIDKNLLASGELDFDYHSKVIRKLIGFQTLSRLLS